MAADNEEEDRRALERWEAEQPLTPTAWEILATGDTRLFAACVDRAFRRAAAEKARAHNVRALVIGAFDGDAVRAEAFLRQAHPQLGGETPLAHATASREGTDEVIRLVASIEEGANMPKRGPMPQEIENLAGPASRMLFHIADLWSMTDDERMRVLGIADAARLKRWSEGDPAGLGGDELVRISHVFGIYRAINTLLPEPARANAWMRAPNKAPLFAGRSAMELIASGNLADLADVHRDLDAQLNT